ncbi:DUF3024 domain-containing protein [Vibrio hannami]|uniref:DUF3024 domain-containing protein n=1 Tax=Vibrio hannami TaxID=2717094 RepID=UPI0024103F9A|nr:DUF3024 domain-containing protein [Vibrio hannami]MDG3085583.1 DUF3024 domain-containing protein [Vibrio hannami]
MKLSEIELFRLEKVVQKFCQRRNQNVPAEMGKAQYELVEDGVYFSKQCFLLDSSHINAVCPVAKLIFNPEALTWKIEVAEYDESNLENVDWYGYPYKEATESLEEQLDELLHDPHNLFW